MVGDGPQFGSFRAEGDTHKTPENPARPRRLDPSLFTLDLTKLHPNMEVQDAHGVIYVFDDYSDLSLVSKGPLGTFVVKLRIKETDEPVVVVVNKKEGVMD